MKNIRKGLAITSMAGIMTLASVVPAFAQDIHLVNTITGPGSHNVNRVSIRHDLDFNQEIFRLRRHLRNRHDTFRGLDARFEVFDFDRLGLRSLRDLDRILDRHDRRDFRVRSDLDRFFRRSGDFDFDFRSDVDIRNDVNVRASTGGNRIINNTIVEDIITGDIDVGIDISN